MATTKYSVADRVQNFAFSQLNSVRLMQIRKIPLYSILVLPEKMWIWQRWFLLLLEDAR